jgi:hypothetical protein
MAKQSPSEMQEIKKPRNQELKNSRLSPKGMACATRLQECEGLESAPRVRRRSGKKFDFSGALLKYLLF